MAPPAPAGGASARISADGRPIALGSFATKAEASRAYRQAAVQALIMTAVVAGMLGLAALGERWSSPRGRYFDPAQSRRICSWTSLKYSIFRLLLRCDKCWHRSVVMVRV